MRSAMLTLCFIALTGCSAASVPSPTPTHTPPPSATPTHTATATASPTPTHTPTPTPTPSPTPTPTDIPTLTPTAAATRVPVTPKPTATPILAAHVFPETPIEPFTRDRFITDMQRFREILESIKTWMAWFSTKCSTHELHVKQLLALLGFDNVPATWMGIYVEHRAMIKEVYDRYRPFLDVCAAGGGEIESRLIDEFSIWLDTARPQVDQMLGRAYQLP